MSEIQENLIEEGYEPNMICNRETENGDCKGILEYSQSYMEAIGMGSTESHLCCEECGFSTEWSYPSKTKEYEIKQESHFSIAKNTLQSIQSSLTNLVSDYLFFKNYNDTYKEGFKDGARLIEQHIMHYVNQAISELKR